MNELRVFFNEIRDCLLDEIFFVWCLESSLQDFLFQLFLLRCKERTPPHQCFGRGLFLENIIKTSLLNVTARKTEIQTDVRETYFKVRGQLTDQQICRQTAGHKGMKKSLVHGHTDRDAGRQAGRRSKKTVTQTTI